jgi:hypothetical protein
MPIAVVTIVNKTDESRFLIPDGEEYLVEFGHPRREVRDKTLEGAQAKAKQQVPDLEFYAPTRRGVPVRVG